MSETNYYCNQRLIKNGLQMYTYVMHIYIYIYMISYIYK